MPFDGVSFVDKKPLSTLRSRFAAEPGRPCSKAPPVKGFAPSAEPMASPVLQILRDARRLIERPENWTRGAYQVADERFCAIGALRAASLRLDDADAAKRAHLLLLQIAIRRGFQSVERMNDESSHRHVLGALDEAIRKAECDRLLPASVR